MLYFATAPKTMEMSIRYGGRGSVRKAPSARMVLFSTEYVGAGALDGPLLQFDLPERTPLESVGEGLDPPENIADCHDASFQNERVREGQDPPLHFLKINTNTEQ